MTIREIICKKIRENSGLISFQDYMNLVLYYPQLGYYSGAKDKISTSGDFVTATSQTSIFACTFARVFAKTLTELGNDSYIIEFGAGTGKFAVDSTLELERLGKLPKKYLIIELSNDLRLRQQEYISQKAPHLYEMFEWGYELPRQKLKAVIFANEVLDAMPVDLFKSNGQVVKQQGVSLDNEEFILVDMSENQQRFDSELKRIQRDGIEFEDGYISEVNTWVRPWIKSLAECLEQGVVLLADYGYHRDDYYRAERSMGTLACYHRHEVNFDPFINIAEQDITAHVDFTTVAESACDNGFELQGFMSQANFLKRADIATVFADIFKRLSDVDKIRYNTDMKELLLGDKLAETFKVIGFSLNFKPLLEVFDNDDNVDYLL